VDAEAAFCISTSRNGLPAKPDSKKEVNVTYTNSTTTTAAAPQPLNRCVVCNAALVTKPNGRRRHFCADRCRVEAHRKPGPALLRNLDFRDSSATPYPSEALLRNPKKTSSNTTTCKGDFGDRGSAVKDRIVTIGLGVQTAQPDTISPLARRAIQTELSARWRRFGVRS
jgi:hypothetical protein